VKENVTDKVIESNRSDIISHPDVRVNHCAYGHRVARLINPRGVTTVSHKYSLKLQDMQLW
jgi:hypothetical protein